MVQLARDSVRAIVLTLCLLAGAAHAQTSETGPPEAAFAGGPIKLTPAAAQRLRTHFQGDKVPQVPQPFRGRLDTLLLAHDWRGLDAAKKDLAIAKGVVPVLVWEQTRFLATGGLGIAETHALDMAETGAPNLSDGVAMMWLYAAAAALTDGNKCANGDAKDSHLDRLRGPVFEKVTKIVRGLPDDRIAAMRDMALRLEAGFAQDRDSDPLCRGANGKTELKPETAWRPRMAETRAMLPKHLAALVSVVKKAPSPKSEPPKPAATKPAPSPEPKARPDLGPAIEGPLTLDPPARKE